jgi:hypothetical protein
MQAGSGELSSDIILTSPQEYNHDDPTTRRSPDSGSIFTHCIPCRNLQLPLPGDKHRGKID